MEISYQPLLTTWVLLVVVGISALLIWIWTRSLFERFFLLMALVCLVLFGFQTRLTSLSTSPPDRPIKLIYENSITAEHGDYPELARQIVDQIDREVGKQHTRLIPLDDRWDSTPFFRDYNRLSDLFSPIDPVQVVIGEGNHTVPGSPVFHRNPPAFRALFKPEPSRGQGGSLRVTDPVLLLGGDRQNSWELILEPDTGELSGKIVLKENEETVSSHPLSPDDLQFDLPVEQTGDPLNYYTVEWLMEGEKSLPAGHPRRTDLGTIHLDQRKQVLVSSPFPNWESGWWGRKFGHHSNWNTVYEFREVDDGNQPSERAWDLIVWHGFPRSIQQLNQLKSRTGSRAALLFIADQPLNRDLARGTLDWLGFESTGRIHYREGPFQLLSAKSAESFFPSLIRFASILNNSPPVTGVLVNLEPGEYRPVLQADREIYYALHRAKSRGFIASDRYHQLAMKWGRYGQEELGWLLGDELIQKLLRMRPVTSEGFVEDRWVFAGQVLSYESKSLSELKIDGPWSANLVGSKIDGQLTLPVPGRYQLNAITDSGRTLEDQLLVMTPQNERIPAGQRGPLFRDQKVFTEQNQLIQWVLSQWEEQIQKKRKVVMAWNHPMLLLLMTGLLMGAWFARDRS